jgi:hypothetical protein
MEADGFLFAFSASAEAAFGTEIANTQPSNTSNAMIVRVLMAFLQRQRPAREAEVAMRRFPDRRHTQRVQ